MAHSEQAGALERPLDKAAFFRIEGTLVKRPTLAAAAWFTLNTQRMSSRITRLGSVALAAGMRVAGSGLAGLRDQHAVTRMAWMGLREMSLDRLEVLGEEYFEAQVLPNLLEIGVDLLREARRQGHRVVLVSDNLDVVMEHLKDHLGADDLLANRLEMRGNRTTGRLIEPIIGGHVSGQWARSWAGEQRIDLEASAGYGSAASDSMLLSALGRPCVVNPDFRLRRMARDLDWPCVEA